MLCRARRCSVRVCAYECISFFAAACFQWRFHQGQPRSRPAANPEPAPLPGRRRYRTLNPRPIQTRFWEGSLPSLSPARGAQPPARALQCGAAAARGRRRPRCSAQGRAGARRALRERAEPGEPPRRRWYRAAAPRSPPAPRVRSRSLRISPQARPERRSRGGGGGSAGAAAPLKSFRGSSAKRRQRGFVQACARSAAQSRRK